MAITLDNTTNTAYQAEPVAANRAALVVAALTAPVLVRIYDGSGAVRAEGTMAAPWATASGATITVGEVTADVLDPTVTAVPDGSWYVRFEGGGRWIRGTFGLPGSGRDFIWSLTTFAVGQTAILGTVSLTATGASLTAPSNTSLPVLTGSTTIGSTLSTSTGSWSGTTPIAFTYQWKRGGSNIASATGSTYMLVTADAGTTITCTVTATNVVSTASATSAGVAIPATTISWNTIPAQNANTNSTVSVASYLNNPQGLPITYALTGSLPAGVTFNTSTAVFSIGSGATAGTIGPYTVSADDQASAVIPPSNTTAPTISGLEQVGYVLTANIGVWAGTAPITYTYQWLRGATNISGATQSTYTVTSTDIGSTLAVRVTATNTAGSATATTGNTAVIPSPSTGGNVSATLQVTSASSGTVPFAVGHAFKKGDAPAYVSVTGATLTAGQVKVLNRWRDGSVKFAVVSGRYTSTANTAATFSFQTSSTDPYTATALSTTDLQTAAPTVSIATPSGTVSWSGADWASPFVTHVAGPVMSNWVYRKPVGSDPTLVAWIEVRLWTGGAVEVLPWVENGYLKIGVGQKVGTYTVTINGTQKFSASVSLLNHQRAVLASGTNLSHWAGTSYPTTPKHDTTYLMATKLVPNYWPVTSSAQVASAGWISSYTPLAQGNWPNNQASTGYSPHIGLLPGWDAMYFTSGGDSRCWFASQALAYQQGRMGVHYRDEATNRAVRMSQHPTLCIDNDTRNDGITGCGPSDVNNYTAAGSGGTPPAYDTAHGPSWSYLPALLTGRWYHIDEVQLITGTHFIKIGQTARNGAAYLLPSDVSAVDEPRGAAWSMRTLASAAVVTPDSDPLHTEYVTSIQNNIDYYHHLYVTVIAGRNIGGHVEALGDFGEPGYLARAFMDDFFMAGFGFMKDTETYGTALDTKLNAFLAYKYQAITGRVGTGSAGTWNYRYAATYNITMSPSSACDWNGGSGPWYSDWGAIATAMAIPAADGGNTLFGESAAHPSVMETGYWGNLMPALAYATDHGAPGALDGYNRIVASPTWAQYSPQFNGNPTWGIRPRNLTAPQPTTGSGLLFSGDRYKNEQLKRALPAQTVTAGYPLTVIMQCKPTFFSATEYQSLFFHGIEGDYFANNNKYHGCGPYPNAPPGGGLKWEIACEAQDFVGDSLQYDRWYTQAYVVWSDGSGKHHRYYYDLPNSAKVVSRDSPTTYFTSNTSTQAMYFGNTPWDHVTQSTSEGFCGILRRLKIFTTNLSIADCISEAAVDAIATTAGAASVYYLNANPTSSDITDKSGKGNHFVWYDNAEKATTWTGSIV